MHFFTGFDNERYCLDVNTSSVFSVDELTESLIKIQPNEELLEKYSIEEIRNAKEILNNFKEKGFLKKYDRKKPLLKNIHNTISLKGATLMVSSKCNLRCKYCFNDGGELPKDSLHSMSEKIAEDSIKFLIDNSEGNLGVSFFGGEPLMNWGIIKHITNICEQTERVWQFSMITNGTIMNEEIAEFLAKHKFHVVVSYEGILQDI